MRYLVLVHILAALTGVMSGFASLLLRKGSAPHRNIGTLFTVAMVLMGLSGAFLATFLEPQMINVIAGLFTSYLVCSGWLAAQGPVARIGAGGRALMVVALGVVLLCLIYAWHAVARGDADSAIGGGVFGLVMLLALAGDVRVLRHGGVAGRKRLARHLWRMCTAQLLGALSLFVSKQRRILPAWSIEHGLNWLPVLLVLCLFIYWMMRTLSSNRRDPAPASVASLSR